MIDKEGLLESCCPVNGHNVLMLQSEVTVPPICSPGKQTTDTTLNKEKKFLLTTADPRFPQNPQKATQFGFLKISNHKLVLRYRPIKTDKAFS